MPNQNPYNMPTVNPYNMPTVNPYNMPTANPYNMPNQNPIVPMQGNEQSQTLLQEQMQQQLKQKELHLQEQMLKLKQDAEQKLREQQQESEFQQKLKLEENRIESLLSAAQEQQNKQLIQQLQQQLQQQKDFENKQKQIQLQKQLIAEEDNKQRQALLIQQQQQVQKDIKNLYNNQEQPIFQGNDPRNLNSSQVKAILHPEDINKNNDQSNNYNYVTKNESRANAENKLQNNTVTIEQILNKPVDLDTKIKDFGHTTGERKFQEKLNTFKSNPLNELSNWKLDSIRLDDLGKAIDVLNKGSKEETRNEQRIVPKIVTPPKNTNIINSQNNTKKIPPPAPVGFGSRANTNTRRKTPNDRINKGLYGRGGANMYTKNVNTDEIKKSFTELCTKFNNIVNRIITTATIFKINSLSSDNFKNIIENDDVIIKNVKDQNEIIMDKKLTLSTLISFMYVNYTSWTSAENNSALGLIYNEFKKNYHEKIITQENDNVEKVCAALGLIEDIENKASSKDEIYTKINNDAIVNNDTDNVNTNTLNDYDDNDEDKINNYQNVDSKYGDDHSDEDKINNYQNGDSKYDDEKEYFRKLDDQKKEDAQQRKGGGSKDDDENQEYDKSQYYLHIKKFTSVMMHFVNNYDSILNRVSNFNDILVYYAIFINKSIDYLSNVIPIIYILEQPLNIRNFKEKLDNIINIENSSKIITYLKLTNRDLNFNTYNKRFKIYVNSHNIGESSTEDKSNMMLVKYNTDNFSYYNPDNINEVAEDVKTIINGMNQKIQNNGKFGTVGDRIDVNKYDSHYLFGKFMNVFLPNLNNKNIADEMKIIRDQALLGKPIFMLGYGASGAGKTSSLIYFNKGSNALERQGILIHLCNIFGNDGFTELEVTSKEFFVSMNQVKEADKVCKDPLSKSPENCDKSKNYTKYPTISSTNVFKYYFQGGEFKLNKNYEYNNIHKYRSKRNGTEDHPFKDGKSLGETMIYLIDTDRFVKATTNNPNSSRSHILVFVKLTRRGTNVTVRPDEKKDKIVNIIVGDFAGVENRFQCGKPDVISRFLKIPRDDGSGVAYYSTEPLVINGITEMDPINGGASLEKTENSVISNETTNNIDYDESKISEYSKITDPIYDFRIPIFRENMTKFGPFTNDKNSKYTEIYQKSVLRSMFLKLILPGSDLKDLNSNEITYKYIGNSNNIEIIKKNYIQCIEELDMFKELQTTIRSFVFSYLLGIEEGNFDNYKEDMEQIYNEMQSLYDRIINTKTGLKSYHLSASQRGSPDASDQLRSYKPEGSKQDIIDNKIFSKEIKNFGANYKIAIENIDSIVEEILNSTSSARAPTQKTSKGKTPVRKGGKNKTKKNKIFQSQIGGARTYVFYARDPNNNSIPIKRTYTASALAKILFENKNFFGKIRIFLDFLNIKYDDNYYKKLKSVEYSAILDKAKLIYGKLWEIIKETKGRVGYGETICESRAIEGDFINYSLREIRNTIKEMLITKNENVLYNSPEYIDACLETYCPNYENCFELKAGNSDPSVIPSTIFNEIMNYLNNQGKNYKDKYEFYREIVVSVFCVFNISRQANNPPPTPYIDINRMKQLFFYETIYENGKRAEFIKLFYELIEKIKGEFFDKVGGLLEIKKDEKDPLTVYDAMDKLINAIKSVNNYYQLEVSENSIILDFINLIDNSNAVSAIGTLEFLDQMSKFNTVNTVCSSKTPYLTKNINEIIFNYGMKDILDIK